MSELGFIFKIWWDNLDPNKIKDFINDQASKLALSFKDFFYWIELEPLLQKLWSVINKKKIQLYPWEFLFIRLTKEVLTNIILNKVGKFPDPILRLSTRWFEYLISRTKSYLQLIPANFCTLLHTMAPVSDIAAYNTQIKKLEKIYSEQSLMDAYDSDDADIIDIINAFEQNYGNHYPLFLSRCKHLGDEWGKHESKIYGNKPYLIFQLDTSNNRTPPDIVKDTLIELIHVRNALSHKDTCGINPVDDNKVLIRDRKPDGSLSYNETIPVEDLWKFFHKLIVLDRGIDIFALYIDFYFYLRKHDQKSVIILSCSCGEVHKVYFPPHITQVVCKNCLKIHTRDNLSALGKVTIKKNNL